MSDAITTFLYKISSFNRNERFKNIIVSENNYFLPEFNKYLINYYTNKVL